ncbi:MAG: lyase family protein [Candidatus Diapherotrites archaeon]
MDKFDAISPLDYRYGTGKDIAEYLSENARIKYQARVEAALAKALAKNGICSGKIAKQIENAAMKVKAKEVYAEEKKIKHDVRALANMIRKRVSKEAKPFVHFSATSYDIVDTASALRYKETTEKLILPKLKALEKTLIKLALRNKKVVQIGRTHGQHASPVTFGFALSEYVSRLGNRIKAIEWAKDNLCGKFSGAVGSYNASSLLVKNPQKLEKDIMDDLGLKVSTHSTQIVEPESLQDLIHTLIGTFSVLANLADDMRNLQRSEIAEVGEYFGSKQVGSSTMPQKRNPINFENVKSLWKEFMPRMSTIYMDAISEHQRDLTNSASARFIPEIFAGLISSTDRMDSVMEKMVVDRENIEKNFNLFKEIVVAEPLYIILAKYKHSDAHESVRKLALESYKTGEGVYDLAMKDKKLLKFLRQFTKDEKELIQNPERYIGLSVRKTEQVCSYWKKELK